MKRFKNFWLLDGSGSPPRRSELLIDGDRVAAVEQESAAGAAASRDTFDLGGLMVAPGFIDVHSHSDMSLPAAPAGESKRAQGITCEVVGNCGLSVFPVTGRNRDHLQELYSVYGVEIAWNDYSGYLAELKRRGAALKLYSLVGHNTLRAAVAGYQQRVISDAEMAEMEQRLAGELEAGAPGLSSGLLYVPGRFSPPEELVKLLRVTAAYDGIYTTHLRSEGTRLLESIDETFEAAREAGLRRVHISHLKTAGRDNWDKLDGVFAAAAAAERDGIRVTFDRYPYTESMTQLSVILPAGWDEIGDDEITRRLRNSEVRREVASRLRAERTDEYWNGVRLVSSTHPGYRGVVGKVFAEISADPAGLVVELLAHDSAGTTAAFAGMSRDNLRRIVLDPRTMLGSDGNALPFGGKFGTPHPRSFGSAPGFLRLLLDNGVEPGEAVRKLTGLPAETFKLSSGIGGIAAGRAADLVVFDPDEVAGAADFTAPETPPRGIRMVVLDGRMFAEGLTELT